MKTVSSCLKQVGRVRLAEKEVVGSAGRDKALSRLPDVTAGAAGTRRESRRGRSTSRIRRMQKVLIVSAGYNGVLNSK
jgi:hypothetical protein